MFESPAYAAAGGAAGAPGGMAGFMVSVFPFLLIFVIFYFLLIRPQQKRMRQHQDMIGAVKRNDIVVTGGGLIGKVTRVDEAEVEVELAPNVRVRVIKGMISEVRQPGGRPANDALPAADTARGFSGKKQRRLPASASESGPDLSKSADPSHSND